MIREREQHSASGLLMVSIFVVILAISIAGLVRAARAEDPLGLIASGALLIAAQRDRAEAIVRQMGLSTVVRPITTAQAGRLARRPAYSVLSQERFAMRWSSLPHWQDALARFMKRVPHLASTTG